MFAIQCIPLSATLCMEATHAPHTEKPAQTDDEEGWEDEDEDEDSGAKRQRVNHVCPVCDERSVVCGGVPYQRIAKKKRGQAAQTQTRSVCLLRCTYEIDLQAAVDAGAKTSSHTAARDTSASNKLLIDQRCYMRDMHGRDLLVGLQVIDNEVANAKANARVVTTSCVLCRQRVAHTIGSICIYVTIDNQPVLVPQMSLCCTALRSIVCAPPNGGTTAFACLRCLIDCGVCAGTTSDDCHHMETDTITIVRDASQRQQQRQAIEERLQQQSRTFGVMCDEISAMWEQMPEPDRRAVQSSPTALLDQAQQKAPLLYALIKTVGSVIDGRRQRKNVQQRRTTVSTLAATSFLAAFLLHLVKPHSNPAVLQMLTAMHRRKKKQAFASTVLRRMGIQLRLLKHQGAKEMAKWRSAPPVPIPTPTPGHTVLLGEDNLDIVAHNAQQHMAASAMKSFHCMMTIGVDVVERTEPVLLPAPFNTFDYTNWVGRSHLESFYGLIEQVTKAAGPTDGARALVKALVARSDPAPEGELLGSILVLKPCKELPSSNAGVLASMKQLASQIPRGQRHFLFADQAIWKKQFKFRHQFPDLLPDFGTCPFTLLLIVLFF